MSGVKLSPSIAEMPEIPTTIARSWVMTRGTSHATASISMNPLISMAIPGSHSCKVRSRMGPSFAAEIS